MLKLKPSNWKNKISDVLTDVLRIVRNHHVKLEGDFVHIVIPVLLLEASKREIEGIKKHKMMISLMVYWYHSIVKTLDMVRG
nr:5891_t:CDS:2 [Entrophospora candida]